MCDAGVPHWAGFNQVEYETPTDVLLLNFSNLDGSDVLEYLQQSAGCLCAGLCEGAAALAARSVLCRVLNPRGSSLAGYEDSCRNALRLLSLN